MRSINLMHKVESPFEKLLRHNDLILRNWVKLETSIFTDSSLSLGLLEQVRRTIFFGLKIELCSIHGSKKNREENRRENLAMAFSELFVLDHTSIYTAHFILLREEFNEKEVSELCTFIIFTVASLNMERIYNLTEVDQQNNSNSLSEVENVFNF